jgi:hypothetical protein
MKLHHALFAFLAVFLITSCSNGDSKNASQTDTNTKSEVNVKSNTCILSNCVNNEIEPSKPAVRKNELRCVEDNGEYVLTMEKNGALKSVLVIATGIDKWGDQYDQKKRCAEIKTKGENAIKMGANEWRASRKNSYPVICGSKNGVCLTGEDGILDIVTFTQKTDVVDMAIRFATRIKGYPSAYAGVARTSSDPNLLLKF